MTYLTVVNKVTVQRINEIEPTINSRLTLAIPPFSVTIDFITYNGLVPISPYTIPMAINNPAKLIFCFLVILFMSNNPLQHLKIKSSLV